MQFPHGTNRCTSKNRRISTIRFQHLKYTQGNCMRNYCAGGAWLQCRSVAAGPGCSAGRWRQGLAAAPVDNGTRPRCRWAAGPGHGVRDRQRGPKSDGKTTAGQISHAIPLRHESTHAQKPQNINDQISTLEIHSGELHAKLLCGRGLAAAPVGGGGAWPRRPWVAAGLGCSARGWRQGLAAVPVGGGRAWPGFETRRRSATQPHWCGGRRRDRRARAGFEARRRTK